MAAEYISLEVCGVIYETVFRLFAIFNCAHGYAE